MKDLIIVPVSRECCFQKIKSKKFDIVLIDCKKEKKFKLEHIHDYVVGNSITDYRSVWLPDDDIKTELKTISKMFSYFFDYRAG